MSGLMERSRESRSTGLTGQTCKGGDRTESGESGEQVGDDRLIAPSTLRGVDRRSVGPDACAECFFRVRDLRNIRGLIRRTVTVVHS